MQSRRKPAFRERVLYYWARNFGTQLEIGEEYQSLSPCVGVYVLDFSDLQGHDFHSVFNLCNLSTGEVLSHALEMHFLELPKLLTDRRDDSLHQWGRFFRIRNEQELEALAMSSPSMKQASDALWWVSNDPNSRQMVEMRELAQITHRITMAGARAEGKAEGKAEGRTEGVAEGAAKSILVVLAARDLSLTEGQRQRILDCTDAEQLNSWLRKAMTLTDTSELFT
jgi:predicted transposase/invertase (TIGR01784 family)